MRADKKPVKLNGTKVMWLSAIKLAVSAGSKIYANKQKNEDGYVRCTAYARISYGRR